MPVTVLIHIANEDPVVGEIENVPSPTDMTLMVMNPHKRDGREIPYLLPEVTTVIYPWNRIMCVEILPSEGEEKIFSFVRE